jgi:hypothetical protein
VLIKITEHTQRARGYLVAPVIMTELLICFQKLSLIQKPL